MSLPEPKVSLTGACSVVYNNTLYEFSSAGFQLLDLEKGSQWKKLSSGQPVTGGVCVGTMPDDASRAAFYVVGGTSSNTSYPGLQKYTYSTAEWETVTPSVVVTQARLGHSAVYLNASEKILVYSGSQQAGYEWNPSTETFTIDVSDNSILSYSDTDDVAAPGVAPLLLQWSASQAVMVGGSTTNTKVTLFDPTAGWSDSGSTLADPIVKGSSEVKAALVEGSDGSKQLYTFDMTTSPNSVNRTALAGAGGVPVTNSAPIVGKTSTRRSVSELGRRADLTAADWPSYNSTFASTTTMSAFSLAADTSGQVVLSGATDDDWLCIFDAANNAWVDATAMLASTETSTLSTTASTSAAATAFTAASVATTSSAPSTSTTAAAAGATTAKSSSSGLSSQAVLGVCLGVIFGVALLLIGLLFLMKRKKQRQALLAAERARRASPGFDEKNTFAAGLVELQRPQYRGHAPQDSQASFSSVAILMNKMQKPELQRNRSNDTKRSSSSSIMKQFKSTIGRPQVQAVPEVDYMPRDLDDDKKNFYTGSTPSAGQSRSRTTREGGASRRSSGWDRYWSGGSTLNMLGIGSGRKSRITETSENMSQYSDPHRMTQDSATVPPLQVDGRPGFSSVHSASPTVTMYSARLKEEMVGEIERPISHTSSSGYSSGIPPSVHDEWETVSAPKDWGADRAPSSVYTQSALYPTPLGAPRTSRPPTGISTQPQLKVAAKSSDMSWLNLDPTQRY
jgi:hypothetical protein